MARLARSAGALRFHHLEGGKLRPMHGSEAQTTKARTAQLLADYKRFKSM